MTQLAYVREGIVHTTLPMVADPAAAYPDLAPFLISCDDTVGHNWIYDATSGTFIDPATLPPPVPQVVSRAQAMIIMSETPSKTNAGKTLLDDVTTAVTAAGGRVLIAWQNTGEFDRNGDFVLMLQKQLGLSDSDLDTLFRDAKQVVT